MKSKTTILRISFFAFFFLIGFSIQAQQEKVDSLRILLETAKEDTNKVNLLNELIDEHRRLSQFDKSLNYSTEALKLAEKLNYKKGLARIHSKIGIIYLEIEKIEEALLHHTTAMEISEKIQFKEGIINYHYNLGVFHELYMNFPEALDHYHKLLDIYQVADEKNQIAMAYNKIAGIYHSQSKYADALKHYYAALPIFEELQDTLEIIIILGQLANIHVNRNEFTKALELFFSALYMSNDKKFLIQKGYVYYGIGFIHAEQKNFPEALNYFNSSIEIFKSSDSPYLLTVSHSALGNLYFAEKAYSEASKNYHLALETSKEIKNPWQRKYTEVESFINLSRLYIVENRAEKAKKWLTTALELCSDIEDREMFQQCYKIMSDADSALRNYKGAFDNYKLFLIYSDSVDNEEITKELIQAETQYLYDQRQAAVQMEQEKKNINQRNFRNTISVSFVGALIFLVVIYRQRNKIAKARKRSDDLLLNILPQEVADELKETGESHAKQFDEVTILFTDFVHFTQTAQQLTPKQLVKELHECFTAFDEIIERNGLEKIKTVGDAYLAVCGLPISDPYHAQKSVQAAIEIRDFIEARKQKERVFEIRIGIHSGSVVAGIVGIKKFAYDIWGNAVNVAARMEQNSEAGKINISQATYNRLPNDFDITYRGSKLVEGYGEMNMYFVN